MGWGERVEREGWGGGRSVKMGHKCCFFVLHRSPSGARLLVCVLHLQLNSLLQVLVGLLHQLLGPQNSVPHHVLGATAAKGHGATKWSLPHDDEDYKTQVLLCSIDKTSVYYQNVA